MVLQEKNISDHRYVSFLSSGLLIMSIMYNFYGEKWLKVGRTGWVKRFCSLSRMYFLHVNLSLSLFLL